MGGWLWRMPGEAGRTVQHGGKFGCGSAEMAGDVEEVAWVGSGAAQGFAAGG